MQNMNYHNSHSPYSTKIPAPSGAMPHIIARGGLQIKVCVRTYRLFFVSKSEDIMFRLSSRAERAEARKAVESRNEKRRKWLEQYAANTLEDEPQSATTELTPKPARSQPQANEETYEAAPEVSSPAAQEPAAVSMAVEVIRAQEEKEPEGKVDAISASASAAAPDHDSADVSMGEATPEAQVPRIVPTPAAALAPESEHLPVSASAPDAPREQTSEPMLESDPKPQSPPPSAPVPEPASHNQPHAPAPASEPAEREIVPVAAILSSGRPPSPSPPPTAPSQFIEPRMRREPSPPRSPPAPTAASLTTPPPTSESVAPPPVAAAAASTSTSVVHASIPATALAPATIEASPISLQEPSHPPLLSQPLPHVPNPAPAPSEPSS